MRVGGNIYLWKGLHDGMRDFENVRLCRVARGRYSLLCAPKLKGPENHHWDW